MPGRDFGPGPFDGPGHVVMGLVFLGLSLVFWLGIPALLVWASLRWIAPRVRGWGAAPAVAQPSAIEALAHRYAIGEIDATTFENMVERILSTQARGRQPYEAYHPYEPPTMPTMPTMPNSSDRPETPGDGGIYTA